MAVSVLAGGAAIRGPLTPKPRQPVPGMAGSTSADSRSVLEGVVAYSGGGGTTGVTSIRPVVPAVWASEATDLL